MLVRFLSYAASAFGSARQRAILASYLVLIFACVGIFSVYQMNEKSSGNAASNTDLESQTDENQQNPVWLSDHQVEQRDKQKPDSSAASNPSDDKTTDTDKTQDAEQPADTTELALSETDLILTAGSISSDIVARINGDIENELTWSIAPDETVSTNDLTIISPANGDEQPEGSKSFRIKTSTAIKPGTYKVTISAKNTELNLSKTLTVTVN